MSTLRPVTHEQNWNRKMVARADRTDWQPEGAVGGQLSVMEPHETRGIPAHICIGLGDHNNGGSGH